MLKINVDNIGDLAVVECEGRIVQSDAAFRLRDAVTLQGDARTVVLDLSEVNAIEGGGLGGSYFYRDGLRTTIFASNCSIRPGQCGKGSRRSARCRSSTYQRWTK